MRRISPGYAIVFGAIGLVAGIWLAIAEFMVSLEDPDAFPIVVACWALLAGVPGVITGAILHYRCWQAVPKDIARTTPGKAVGLVFVPFFNFYWYFVSLVGLAEDCAKARGSEARGRGLGITLGILSITAYTSMADGLLAIPVVIAAFVVWLLYTLEMVAAANALIENAASEMSDTGEQEPQGQSFEPAPQV